MFSALERLIAFRYLRSRRQEGFISVIAWFSLAGIALGVATLIVVMSVMNGFRAELLSRILGLNGHISVMAPNQAFTDFDRIATQVRQQPGVTAAVPLVEGQALVIVGGRASGVVVRGMRPQDLANRNIIADNIKTGELSKITGTETITYFNYSPDELKYVWLQLDQNLFDKNSINATSQNNSIQTQMSSNAVRGLNAPSSVRGSVAGDFSYKITAVKDPKTGKKAVMGSILLLR